jgi:hypothetical protein
VFFGFSSNVRKREPNLVFRREAAFHFRVIETCEALGSRICEALKSGICEDLKFRTCEALGSGICGALKSGTCEALESVEL